MKELTLNLIGKYFKMILGGTKTVEYRKITPLYCAKFLLYKGEHKTANWWEEWYFNSVTKECDIDEILYGINFHRITFKKFSAVKFNNGMRKLMPRMKLEFFKIEIGEGVEKWGAVPKEIYFCIKLGKLLKKENTQLLK